MKKYIYGVLVCAMTAAFLGGCGSKPEEQPVTETTEQETTIQKTEFEQITELMKQNLELSEYFDEAVNLMATDEWSRIVTRDYAFNDESGIRMYIRADGDTSAVWYYKEKTTLMLKKTKDLFYVLETGSDYNGQFEAWILDPMSGNVFHEEGMFADGVLTGDYTVYASRGSAESEIFSLWNNRETMEYVVYRGNFDEEGKTTVKQLEDTEKTVYAFDETGDRYLYAETADKVFSVKTLGFGESTEQSEILLRQAGVVVKEEKPQTTSTIQKPAQKPVQTPVQKPTQIPDQTPTQAPAQKPVEEPEEEMPETPEVPDLPSLDESGDNSGDVDIEWSDDIL